MATDAVNVTKPVLAGNSNTSLRFGFAYSPCTGRSLTRTFILSTFHKGKEEDNEIQLNPFGYWVWVISSEILG